MKYNIEVEYFFNKYLMYEIYIIEEKYDRLYVNNYYL